MKFRPFRPGPRLVSVLVGAAAAVLVLYPIAFLLQASLSVGDPQARPPEAYGLDNFADLPRYGHIFANTVSVAVAATAMAVVFGFVMGWILSRTNVPGRGALVQLMALPYYVTPLMGALAEYGGYTLFKEKGAEIDFVAPPDGLPATPALIGVVNRAPHPEAAKLFVDWALSNRGQSVYQTQTILLYGSVRNDAPPMATGKKLADFKLLFPSDWTDFQASHGAFVKEWNALMGL